VVKKAAIILVVLVGLLVVADFGAAAAAEYQVSKRLRSYLDLRDDPAVRVHGFPFLLQAFSGDYPNVEVAAEGVNVARLNDLGVEATLHHVRVPFSDLVSGSVQTVHIDEVVGRVRIRATELQKLINSVQGLRVEDLRVEEVTNRDRSAAGQQVPDNAVKLSGVIDLSGVADALGPLSGVIDALGRRPAVTVIASLELVGGQVQVRAQTARANDRTLPPAFERSVLDLFTQRLDPGTLPFRVTPTAVRADDGALIVEGTAPGVALNTAGSGG
jgi:hypothetical protein